MHIDVEYKSVIFFYVHGCKILSKYFLIGEKKMEIFIFYFLTNGNIYMKTSTSVMLIIS